MARKIKASIPLEEKLQKARLSEEDYPYGLPVGWNFYKLSGVTSRIKRGKSPKYVEHSNIPVFAQKCNQKDGNINLEKAQFLNPELLKKWDDEEFLQDKDIVINSTGTGTLGRVGLYRSVYALPFNIILPDSHITVVRTEPVLDEEYLFYYLKSKQAFLELQGVGSTNQKELRPDVIGDLAIPLPASLEDQRFIVEVIKRLFEKLDNASDCIQNMMDKSTDRMNAVLNKAFSGELTKGWREEHKELIDEWRTVTIQDYCEKITCGKTPKEHISADAEIPYLKVYNIVNNQINFEDKPQFIPREIHETKLKSSILKSGDVVMNIVGPPLRKIAIIPDTYPEWNMNQAIVRFRPLSGLNNKYLYYALVYPHTLDEVVSATKGVVGQANISISQSRALTIPLPSIEEQEAMVNILDRVFEKEDRISEQVDSISEKIWLFIRMCEIENRLKAA